MGATYSGLSSLLRKGVSKVPKGFRASEVQAKNVVFQDSNKEKTGPESLQVSF